MSIQVKGTVYIEESDFVDEIPTSCLLNELIYRIDQGKLSKVEISKLQNIVKETSNFPDVISLTDIMKRDWVIANWDNIKY